MSAASAASVISDFIFLKKLIICISDGFSIRMHFEGRVVLWSAISYLCLSLAVNEIGIVLS